MSVHLEPSRNHAQPIGTDKVSWDLIQSWANNCSTDPQHFRCRPKKLIMDGFRVIDCLSRAVVPLPAGAKYAALSYVWGRTAIESLLDGDVLPAIAPLTIEDAMYCTRQLGFCYLWVDRYCIDQASPSKHLQIQNMDSIYGCASVTIINAAGEDAGCGLPGVSKVKRTTQQSFHIGDEQFLIVSRSKQIIDASKWASRGWTLQEGLMSKVRLVFTHSHVYFQCRERYFCEGVAGANDVVNAYEVPPYYRSSPNASYFNRYMQAFTDAEDYDIGDWWPTFDALLSQYLSRSLTFDSDILVAFLAVLRSLGVDQFWGVPFRLEDELSPETALLKRLTWLPLRGEDKLGDKPLVLRRGFPTWSWAAWKGEWRFENRVEIQDKKFEILETKVAVETRSGQCCSLAEYCSIMERTGDPDLFLPSLDIEGWTTLVQHNGKPEPEQRQYSISDQEGRGLGMYANVMDMFEPEWDSSGSSGGTWPALVLIEEKEFEGEIYCIVGGLLLKPCQNGTYQRLGVLEKAIMNPERPSKERLRLWMSDRYGGVLECERRSIRLV